MCVSLPCNHTTHTVQPHRDCHCYAGRGSIGYPCCTCLASPPRIRPSDASLSLSPALSARSARRNASRASIIAVETGRLALQTGRGVVVRVPMTSPFHSPRDEYARPTIVTLDLWLACAHLRRCKDCGFKGVGVPAVKPCAVLDRRIRHRVKDDAATLRLGMVSPTRSVKS